MSLPSTFFAQPLPRTKKPAKRISENQPPGYHYLASSLFGDVYCSENSTTILKLFIPKSKGKFDDSQAEAKSEFRVLEQVGGIAPDYVPVPSALTRVNGCPAIQMPNVGNSIITLLTYDQKVPESQRQTLLDPNELALCILQSIHFILLINDKVHLDDLHYGNVCVQCRGPEIRLRFIDTGKWWTYAYLQSDDEDYNEANNWMDVVISNTCKMFWDTEEDEGLWREVSKPFVGKREDRECPEDDLQNRFIQLMILLESFDAYTRSNIYTVLLIYHGLRSGEGA